jgi:hypothetical protein
MDYKSLLSDFPSGAEKDLFIRDVGNSEEKFKKLLDLALSDIDPVAWRATWILDGAAEKYPEIAVRHIRTIVARLPEIKSTGTLRSLLRLLCRYEIHEDDQGILIDLCFSYMVSELYPVAVKVHAMQIIYNHVLIYPDLKEELVTVILDQVGNNTVGFKSRGMRIIKQMEKLK